MAEADPITLVCRMTSRAAGSHGWERHDARAEVEDRLRSVLRAWEGTE